MEEQNHIVITIDGPAGSGKSSVAKLLAKKWNLKQIDSGALYRAFTYLFLKEFPNKTKVDDEVLKELLSAPIEIQFRGNQQEVLLNGKILEEEIRRPEITQNIKKIADHPKIRNRVSEILQQAASKYNIIADGRDMGTVVFPNATAKFFLTADLKTRAKRRYEEFLAKYPDISLAEVEKMIAKRDEEDRKRKVGALRKAEDAVSIDTTTQTLKEVVSTIEAELKKRQILSD